MKPRFAELHPKTEYHDALLETGLGRSLARAIVAFQLIEDALRSAAEFCSAPAVESEIDAKFLPTIDDTAFRRTEKLLEVIKQLRKRFLSLVPADKALRKRSFLLSERTHADTLAAVCSDLEILRKYLTETQKLLRQRNTMIHGSLTIDDDRVVFASSKSGKLDAGKLDSLWRTALHHAWTIERLGSHLRVAFEALEAIAWTRGDNDNVRVTLVHVPEVDVREVRTRMGLSQAQFATKFGFPPATLRNWEQGCSRPDAPTRVLLAVLAKHPEVVENVLRKAS